MTQFRINHSTIYSYSDRVSLCHNVAHLRPRLCAWQTCESTKLIVGPIPAVIVERLDYFGNPATYFTVQEPHAVLKIAVEHSFTRTVYPLPPGHSPPWEEIRDRLPRDRSFKWLDAYQFVFDSRYAATAPTYAEYAAVSFTPGRPIIEAAQDLTRRINTDFVYDPRATTVATPVSEVFDTGVVSARTSPTCNSRVYARSV